MKKILIIEDDQIVANVYSNKFKVEGYNVQIAHDGLAGVAAVESFNPDLIILDLMLPQLDGVEVMKRVRAMTDFEKTPILVFSNTYLSSTIKDAWKAGATKCFSKSGCTPKQVLDAVRSLIDAPVGSISASPQMVKTATPAAPMIDAPIKMKMAEPAPAPDPEKEFTKQFPGILSDLRAEYQALVKAASEATRLHQLDAMNSSIHALVGSASVAGLTTIARVADATEALLRELTEHPENLNPSTLRTVAGAIDFIEFVFKRGKAQDLKPNFVTSILVVDDELLSRRAVTHALEKAKLQSTDIDDPIAALKLLTENQFDLVVLDADMPGMNGFELCAKLRGLPEHKKTPVMFVTSLNDFEARANSTMAGANEFIAKPFLFIELALKALVFVLRHRIESSKFQV